MSTATAKKPKAPPFPEVEPESDELSSLVEMHPAAVLVCLGLYFAKRYQEIPPRISRSIEYDGCLFLADDHREESGKTVIRLTIKHGARGDNPRSEIHSFDYDSFAKVYVEA